MGKFATFFCHDDNELTNLILVGLAEEFLLLVPGVVHDFLVEIIASCSPGIEIRTTDEENDKSQCQWLGLMNSSEKLTVRSACRLGEVLQTANI